MQEATRVRMTLANELSVAVARDELRILYQPIIDLASGNICKAEALVRWQHPVRGLLNPAEFIGVAESSGMIIGIGDWVFQQAAREVQKIQSQGIAGVPGQREQIGLAVPRRRQQLPAMAGHLDGRRMRFRVGIPVFQADFG